MKSLEELNKRFTHQQPPGRIVLVSEVGSTMHGISVGNDDLDLMGIVIEGPEYVIGLDQWETSIQRTKPDGVRSEPGDIDLVFHSLRKFIRLAVKGNPTILQVLWIPYGENGVIFADHEFHDAMTRLRDKLISKRAGYAYLGYLMAQKMRLTGERGQKDVNRPELVEKYGFDTKFAAHAVRLGFQGIELLTTGKLVLPIPKDGGRELLKAIRLGHYPLSFVLQLIGDLENSLRAAIEHPIVPAEPDHDSANAFLIDQYQRTWNWRDA